MKKILEVLECSNGELKFNTDVDVIKDSESIIDIPEEPLAMRGSSDFSSGVRPQHEGHE